MASVTAQEIPETQAFMQELWNLIKKYYKPESTNEYWKALDTEMNDLREKHNRNKLNSYLMLALLEFLCEEFGDPGEYKDFKAKRIAEDFIKENLKGGWKCEQDGEKAG